MQEISDKLDLFVPWLVATATEALYSLYSLGINAMESLRWLQLNGPRSNARMVDRKTCEVCVQLPARQVKFRFKIPRGPRTSQPHGPEYRDFFNQDGTAFVRVLSKSEVIGLPSKSDTIPHPGSSSGTLKSTTSNMRR